MKLYQPLSGVKPEDMKQEEWNLLDRQALGVISVAFNIVNEKTTTGLMKGVIRYVREAVGSQQSILDASVVQPQDGRRYLCN